MPRCFESLIRPAPVLNCTTGFTPPGVYPPSTRIATPPLGLTLLILTTPRCFEGL